METSTVAITPNPISNNITPVYAGGVDSSAKWDFVIDCVTYPVHIKPLHFWHEEEEHNAAGVTNTGRDSEFYGIVVDRNRNGKLSTISTVTGLYDTIAASEVYTALRNDLNSGGIENTPQTVYVSGNGGKHQLLVKLDGLEWVSSENKVSMNLLVVTSVDSSTKHTVRLAAMDENGAEIMGVGNATFNLSARHTKSIRERHAAFSVVIDNLVQQWNDTIIPTMMLMNDCTFSKGLAVDILGELMEDANIPETHQTKAMLHYEALQAGKSESNLLGVCTALSSYLSEELANKPERLNEFKERLLKKSDRLVRKYLAKS